MKRWHVVVAWIVLWIPLSVLFPHHVHIPIPAALMPVFFPIFLSGPGAGGWTAVQLAYLPAAVFWGVLAAALFVASRLIRARARNQAGHEAERLPPR